MNVQFTPYILPSALGAILSLSVAWLAWRRRPARGALALALMCLASGIWGLGNVLELSGADVFTKYLGLLLEYPGVLTTAPLTLVFAFDYTGRDAWLTRRRLLAYALLPALSYGIILTNPLHQWMWVDFHLQPGPYLALAYTPGPWWWITIIYSYLMLLAATILLVKRLLHSWHIYRLQLGLTLLGVFAPWISNIIYLAHLNPIPHWDMTPLAFSITGLSLGWGLLRLGMFDLAPVAREMLVESMSDGMLVLDRHDRLVDFNGAMEEILGQKLARAIGQPAGSVLQPWTALTKQYEEQHNTQAEIALAGLEQLRHFDLRISELTDRRGEYSGRLIVLRDITERKLAEQALQQYTARLEASNAELDAFAHTVAHDLKTPLTSLLGFAMLLNQRATRWPPERIQSNTADIIQTGMKMNDIINELLLLADVRRSESLEYRPLDMRSIVTEAQWRLAAALEERRGRLSMPSEWPIVYGHGPWVEEVWVNYISNALKYGGNPPEVELGYFFHNGGDPVRIPERSVKFWVRDNGPGLTPEEQQRLFTQFTRLHTTRAQGHGLGLSIVQRIVERLGGEVGVDSRGGHGSLFWFTLPTAPGA